MSDGITTALKHGSLLDIENQRCVYPVGKALGGSSTVNYLLYVRGNRKDFDKWAQMGNSGWAYDDLLPLFKKIERANIGEYSTDEKYHSREGLLSVEFPQHRSGLSNMFLEAAVQRNISIIDYNGEHQMGMGIIQGTSQNGGRHSAASAYLKPIYLKRDNLHIMPNSLVSRILIDDMKKEAFGVEYYHGGQKHRVYARKEVILSAGPVNSPQLLMLSGVGPKEHLEQLNIPTIVDLPVGEKFYDHIAMLAPTYLVNTTGLSPHVKKIGLLPLLQYVQGKGFLTSYLGIEAVSFHKTPFSPLPPDQPDYEIVFQSTSLQSDLGFGFRKLAKIRTDVYDTLYGPIESPEQDTWSTIILNLHPRSTGSIRLKNNRVQSYPIIRYPFYEDIQDLETLVEGIKEVQRFAETRVMKSIGSSILNIPLPDCMHLEFLSDDYWRCYARHLTFMMVHMVASNKMGPETDAEAVVDPQLRVHGIKHLRVADTSIIPTTISGHTQAISYVIGEKLAIMLKETWQ